MSLAIRQIDDAFFDNGHARAAGQRAVRRDELPVADPAGSVSSDDDRRPVARRALRVRKKINARRPRRTSASVPGSHRRKVLGWPRLLNWAEVRHLLAEPIFTLSNSKTSSFSDVRDATWLRRRRAVRSSRIPLLPMPGSSSRAGGAQRAGIGWSGCSLR